MNIRLVTFGRSIVASSIIELICDDLKYQEFDCLFIDAAKAQYQKFFEKYMPEWAFVHHIRIGFTDKKDKDGYTIFDKDGVPKRGSTDSIEYMHAVWHKSNLKPDYTKLVLI